MASEHTIPRLDFADLPMAADRGVGWAMLRDTGPLVEGDGFYTLTRRDDVLEALRNTEVYSSKAALFDPLIEWPAPALALLKLPLVFG